MAPPDHLILHLLHPAAILEYAAGITIARERDVNSGSVFWKIANVAKNNIHKKKYFFDDTR